MTRTTRTVLATMAAVVALTVTAAPSPAAERKPLRSGTITGWGVTWPATGWGISSMFTGTAMACDANPECRTWLESACHPGLAGRDPAVTASIVDLAKIAEAATPRQFAWHVGNRLGLGLEHDAGGVVVQMWTKDCDEIHRWYSLVGHDRWSGRSIHRMQTTFPIPLAAKWMTVTTNDTTDLRWTLR